MSNQKAPRILFFVNSVPYFYSHRLCLALAAQEEGFEVHIAAPRCTELEYDLGIRGFRFHLIPINRMSINPIVEFRSFLSILLLLVNIKPDILHLIALKAVAYGGIAARIAKVKGVISAVAGLGFSFSNNSLRAKIARRTLIPLLKFGLHKRTVTIFQNVEDLELFIKMGVIERSQAVVIRGAGVNTEKFAPLPDGDRNHQPVVVLAARMLWNKGIREFYQAAKKLKSAGIPAKFVLLGGIDEENPSGIPRPTLEAWNKEGIIEWKGHSKNMALELASSDIACLPTVYAEGLPKSLLEAAACGLPIVATDTPGCRDICRHDWNGILVPPRNVDALAEALRKLISSHELRMEMGTRGRELIKKDFSERIVVGKTMALYREFLENHNSQTVARLQQG